MRGVKAAERGSWRADFAGESVMLIAYSGRSIGKFVIVGLLCLSIASCAWMNRGTSNYIGYQRALYGQIYLLIIASSTVTLPVTAAMVYKQIGPRYWDLVRNEIIRRMVIDDFNGNFLLWALVSNSLLVGVIHQQFHRGGFDRAPDKI